MRSTYFLIIIVIISSLSCRRASQQRVAEVQATPSTQNTAGPGPLGVPSPVVIDKPYYGTGVVAVINTNEGWIEIDHEEIKGLMPAMQMEFWVRDRSLLKTVSVGDRVDFTVIETGKGEYITELKKVQAVP